MANITVTFADGAPHTYSNVPDNITPDQIEQRATQDFAGRKVAHLDRVAGNSSPQEAQAAPAEQPNRSMLDQVRDFSVSLGHHAANLPHGIAQLVENGVNYGAKQLPDNAVSRGINNVVTADNAAMAQREKDYQASVPNSAGAYSGAAVGEIAPFAANAVAKPLQAAGSLLERFMAKQGTPALASKIGSGVAQGGIVSAAMPVTDGDYGASKLKQLEISIPLGGAAPLLAKAAGGVANMGRNIINPVLNPETSAIEKLVQDAGGTEQAHAAIDRAVAAGNSMSGQPFTLGQAGKNAGLSSTERARSAVNPENFQEIYQAQRDARVAALQGIGGDDIALQNAINTRSDNAHSNYTNINDQVFPGGDDLTHLLSRARSGGALGEAQKIAGIEGRKFSIPVVDDLEHAGFNSADDAQRAAYGGLPDAGMLKQASDYAQPEASRNLLSEIRQLGGVSMKDGKDLMGEGSITKMGVQGGVFSTKGAEVGDMVRKLVDRGVIPPTVLHDVDGGAQFLRDSIQHAAGGGKNAEDMALRAASESYHGSAPDMPLSAMETFSTSAKPEQSLREVVGQAVKGGDLHSVKMGIDQAIGTAMGHQKAALVSLKKDFLEWMGNQSPEYLKANAQYATDSRPINQMKIAQKLTDALTGNAYAHGAEPGQAIAGFMKALKNAPSIAKSETGMKQPLSKVMDPEQMNKIMTVAKELAKDVDLQNLGKGVGSDTAQKLARGNAINMLSSLVKVVPYGEKGLNAASALVKVRVNKQLDELLQNPEQAKSALAKLSKGDKNKLRQLLESNPLSNQLINSSTNAP